MENHNILTTLILFVATIREVFGLERTGLYKKISAILEKIPSTLIKSIRLRRAVDLIKNTDLSIQEIAEQTGFYSSSHLARSIQSEYSCKPTDLRRKL